MAKTLDVDIAPFWGSPARVTIKRLTFGDICDIRDSIPINMLGTTQSARPQVGQMSMMTLQRGILIAPFIKESGKPTVEELRNIDGALGDFLVDEINKLSNISPN